ncbi:MAG: hypothetical protein CVV53_04275 [Spirochaetae bacterium HGW-Spirochaetae-9]|nr:MAG: hypothetical protein CVV53_04275 [Spirochaetae bacterium HGW-Spirochaetae-9]
MASLAEISLRIGWYVFGFLLCVNFPLAVVKLYEEKKYWRIQARSLLFSLTSLLAGGIVGIVAALLALPVRVPLLSDTSSSLVQEIGNGFLEIFPRSMAAVLLSPGGLIVPALIFALSVGLAMAHDPIAARPVANLLDSLSRILHTINVFITEIVGILLIPISARAFHVVSASTEGGIYSSFLFIVAVASFGLIAVVIPLVVFLINGRKNPFPLIFSNIPAVLAAFMSGNLRFSSGSAIRLARENIGIKRRYNAVIMPSTLIFGRMGTAFIAALAFVIILSSYSQLTISLPSLFLIALLIPAATIVASMSLDAGPIVVLTLSCGLFGRGFENGYLVMVPVAMILAMEAALIDALWMGLAQALASPRLVPLDPKDLRHFI